MTVAYHKEQARTLKKLGIWLIVLGIPASFFYFIGVIAILIGIGVLIAANGHTKTAEKLEAQENHRQLVGSAVTDVHEGIPSTIYSHSPTTESSPSRLCPSCRRSTQVAGSLCTNCGCLI